jgi:DNA-directed RNA polymerase sigma subunit (sigma70/sigma32)
MSERICPTCEGSGRLLDPDFRELRRTLDEWRGQYRSDRAGTILRLHRAGFTLTEISMLVGVSRERVRLLEKRALEVAQRNGKPAPAPSTR